MGGWLDAWIDTFRSLGEALLAVLKAELATLQEDLKGSSRHLEQELVAKGQRLYADGDRPVLIRGNVKR